MASAISEIYTSLSGMSITGVTARNIEEVKLSINQGDLPVSMLLPSTSGELEFVALGSLNKITWVIRDLCLWAPLSAGAGIQDYAEDMVDYIKDYLVLVKDNRCPTDNSSISGVAVQMGPIPWAAEDFWAVDINITVEEIL